MIIECAARTAIRTQRLDSRQRRTATLGLCDPQDAPRFRPTVPNRLVFHQVSEKTARFSIRSRKAPLSPVSQLVRCVWPFWAERYRCASCRAGSRETTRLTGPCPARQQWGPMEWTGLVSLVSQLQRSCQSQETSMPQASVGYTGHDATEVPTCLAGESVTSVALEMPHMVEGQPRFLPNLPRNTKRPDQVRP